MERLEVLKGPQGALYGGSNIGGAVKFVTRRPELGEWGGHVELEAGDQNMRNYQAVVNVPLGERAALRLFAYSKEDDGFVEGVAPVRRNGRSNIDDTLWAVRRSRRRRGAQHLRGRRHREVAPQSQRAGGDGRAHHLHGGVGRTHHGIRGAPQQRTRHGQQQLARRERQPPQVRPHPGTYVRRDATCARRRAACSRFPTTSNSAT